MTKYWSNINQFVSYEEGYCAIYENREIEFITRKEWNGVHYINRYDEYCILLGTGEMEVHPINIDSKNKPDWIIVDITDEARKLIEQHALI